MFLRKNKLISCILTMILVVGMVFFAQPSWVANATTKQEIDKTQNEKKELENKLDKTQDKLDDLKDEHKQLKKELNNLNAQLNQVSDELAVLDEQIREKDAQIDATKQALTDAVEKEEWQYECMLVRVRKMYEKNDKSYVNAILDEGSFSEMLNTADRFERIAQYDQQKLQEFKDNRAYIEEVEATLEAEKVELDNLLVQAEAKKSKVSGLISQTSNSITKYAGAIEDAEKKALEYEAEIKKKDEDLEYLKKKYAEELKKSQAAAKGTWRDISQVKFADGDRKLLANIIYCEAGAESYEGQLAVGAVVINRVLSGSYPDTVVGVVYQKSQFTPASSGRLELALSADKATSSCYKAADEAMAGMSNVGSCVYFRMNTPSISGKVIGCHVFY